MRTSRPILLTAALACTACSAPASGTSAANGEDPALRALLDGRPASLVVVGYSTSYFWPTMLQDMLDEHTAGERVYTVLNAVVGGSPVGRWISEPGSEDYEATYGAMQRDFFGTDARLRGDAPSPTVAVVQQSLQRTPTPATRLGPVTSVDHREGIEAGADALERLARQLHEDGVAEVVVATHIYKEGFEPEVGNERFALEALLRRDRPGIRAGPDVWSPTLREHPNAFTDDRLHPNERGGKILAEGWYRVLAGADARDDVIERMHARRYDVDAITDAYLAWRRTGTE